MYRILIVSFALVLVFDAARTGLADDQIDPNLIGWWTLDEGLGATTADSSGNGHNGAFVGEPLWTDGFSGSALEFDGIDDYVLCAEREGTKPGVYPEELMPAGGFTVACWVKLRTFAYFSSFVGNGMDTGDDECGFFLYNFGWNGENGRDFGLAIRTETGMEYVETPNIYDTDTWYHLAATYDGENVSIYVNGVVSVGPQSVGGPIRWVSQMSGNYPERFAIGVWLDPGYDLWVDGAIDEVRYYSRAMAASEVKQLAFRPKASDPNPSDGAADVIAPLLRWSAGSSAQFHDVYLGTSPDLGTAALVGTHLPMSMYYHAAGLEPGVTYYWRVDEIESDMTTVHTGDTWSFLTQALTAYDPAPADGAVDVSPSPVLTWRPARAAASHRVYFSEAFSDVNDAVASADKDVQEETTFTPGDLDSLTQYYWRVDEILAGDSVQPGPVWSFSTYLSVDDFESYNDDIEGGGAVFQTWIDGLENGSGAVAGYLESANGTFNETTIVHGGGQAMPVDYNNAHAPYYSEVERTWVPVRDWTADGIGALVLHVRGSGGNAAAPLYLALEDSSSHSAVVVHPDPEIVRRGRWAEWRIPLSTVSDAGVNLAAVKTVYIGVGDRNAPVVGGAGHIYIDDVYLTRP